MYCKRAYLKPWSFLYLENMCVGFANLLVHVAILIPFFLLIYFANPKKTVSGCLALLISSAGGIATYFNYNKQLVKIEKTHALFPVVHV